MGQDLDLDVREARFDAAKSMKWKTRQCKGPQEVLEFVNAQKPLSLAAIRVVFSGLGPPFAVYCLPGSEESQYRLLVSSDPRSIELMLDHPDKYLPVYAFNFITAAFLEKLP